MSQEDSSDNKLEMHSLDQVAENLAWVADRFPGCITETRNEEGELVRAVDFDLLRQELSTEVVEGPQERYHLNWPGKRESLLAANAPIAKTLRPCREESVDFGSTRNLCIEGDNLDVLKLLQETYLNKVDLIYIDPPYNTGNDFIYDDDFSEDAVTYLLRSIQSDDTGSRLTANTEANGRFHSDWLSMLYPRLRLAHRLLANTGVIFISVDDGERANLQKMCDEIFGEQNFQADIAWQKRYTRSNNTVDFTTMVEHVLVYSRSSDFRVNLLPRSEEADARYTNPDNDSRGAWKGASFLNPATPSQRPKLCYPITNPNTGNVERPTTNAWRRSKAEYETLLKDNRLYWGSDGTSPVPSIKMFLSEARGMTPVNFWPHDYAGNTDDGTRDLSCLMDGRKLFSNPKPVQLIKRVLEHGANADALIVDFFAGSGTTGQAVIEKNLEDGGHRRFILVQEREPCDEDSFAYQAGLLNIAEITKERLRRVGAKVSGSSQLLPAEADVGFRTLKLASSCMKDVYYRPDSAEQKGLATLIDNIKDDRTDEDLLFQVLLDWGVDLSLPTAKEEIAGKEVFFVDTNALAACFGDGIDEEFVKELARREPLRAVFRDAGYGGDDVKINVEQIFKQLSPSTEVKTI